jgi:predicted PurR-regulated permease PerM
MLVPANEQEKTKKIIAQSGSVVQEYLVGVATMVGMLWILYGIGFSIVGIKSALFFAVLCGLLEIIPFVGNLTGSALTVLMAFSQGGGLGMAMGVLLTYGLVQTIQAYLISPLVVGAEVHINPLFTIIILVAGQFLWGISGMFLAIPLLAIAKIICDNVEELHPYAYLIGQDKKKKSHRGKALVQKIKSIFQR